MADLPTRRAAKPGCLTQVVVGLFYSLLILAGLITTAFGLPRTWSELACAGWPQVPVEGLKAGVRWVGDWEWQIQVSYRYRYGQTTYDGSRYGRYDQTSDDLGDLQRLADQITARQSPVCFVDPAQPRRAVLDPSVGWTGPIITLVGLFLIALGVVMAYLHRQSAGLPTPRPLSQPSPSRTYGMFCFFGVFTLVGALLGYSLLLRPFLAGLVASSWRQTPCTIERAALREHQGEDGRTFSVAVLYRYQVDGRTYRSSRYAFWTGSSNVGTWRTQVVQDLDQHRDRSCWVNPADPYQAVLVRHLPPDWWMGLIPLIFLVVGLIGQGFALRSWRGSPRTTATIAPEATPGAARTWARPQPGAPRQLTCRGARILKFAFLLGFTLLWNGMVLGMLVSAWLGHGGWWLRLFSLPFGLVGVILIGSCIYTLLRLFTPLPRLRLEPGQPRVGEECRLDWEFSGKVESMTSMRIILVGEEAASYRRGTDTITDTQVFYEQDLIEASDAPDLVTGTVRFRLLERTMPTWKANHNEIRWKLLVKGVIPAWPDVDESFTITVLPAATSGPRHA